MVLGFETIISITIWLLVSLYGVCFLLCACASVNRDSAAVSESSPILSVESKTVLNQPVDVHRNDFLIELLVKPVKLAKVTKGESVNTEISGQFILSTNDDFFSVQSEAFGAVYCSYTNIHKNVLRTILNQGCLGDQDEDGHFETFFLKNGADFHDVGGFLYHDSEITRLTVPEIQAPIAYSLHDDNKEHAFLVAVRFKKITKRKGERYAIFDIVTKRSGEDTMVCVCKQASN